MIIITIPCPTVLPAYNPYPADRWRLSAFQLADFAARSRRDQMTERFGARCVRIEAGRASFHFDREADAVLFRLRHGGEVRKSGVIAPRAGAEPPSVD
jgi:hypothetical protein